MMLITHEYYNGRMILCNNLEGQGEVYYEFGRNTIIV